MELTKKEEEMISEAWMSGRVYSTGRGQEMTTKELEKMEAKLKTRGFNKWREKQNEWKNSCNGNAILKI